MDDGVTLARVKYFGDMGHLDTMDGPVIPEWEIQYRIDSWGSAIDFEVFERRFASGPEVSERVPERFAVGVLKWDGCLHVDFEQEVHLCGPDDDALEVLRKAIFSLGPEMDSWDF